MLIVKMQTDNFILSRSFCSLCSNFIVFMLTFKLGSNDNKEKLFVDFSRAAKANFSLV
jgi:hypothetical protein